MAKINKEAQEIIDRISKAADNYGRAFNFDAVVNSMKRHYALLNVSIPECVEVSNLEEAYKTAWDAAWGAELGTALGATRNVALGAARYAALDVARDAAWNAARNATRNATRNVALDVAWDVARDAAWGAACINTKLTNKKVLHLAEVELCLLEALENGLGFYFPMKDKLLLVPMPKLRLDAERRLHSEITTAVTYKDETGYYFLHGIRFDKKLWKSIVSKTITPQEILKLNNQEQKSAAMSVYGWDKILAGLKTYHLSEELVMIKGEPYKYEVFEADLGDDDVRARFVKVKCWSKGTEHVLRVNPRDESTRTPFGAIAWTFNMNEEEYKKVTIEA